MRSSWRLAPYEDALTMAVRRALHIAVAAHQHRTSDTQIELECHLGVCSRVLDGPRMYAVCSSPALLRNADSTGYLFASGVTRAMMECLQLALVDAKLVHPSQLESRHRCIKVATQSNIRRTYVGALDERGVHRATLQHVCYKTPSRTEEISGGTQWGVDVRLALSEERALPIAPVVSHNSSAEDNGGSVAQQGTQTANDASVVYPVSEVWPDDTPRYVYLQQRKRLAIHPYFTLELASHNVLVDMDMLRFSRDGHKLEVLHRAFHQRRTDYHVEVELDLSRISRMWRRLTGTYCAPPPLPRTQIPRQRLLPNDAALWRADAGDPFLRHVAQELLSLIQFLTDPQHLY